MRTTWSGTFTWSNGKKCEGEFKDGGISSQGTSSLHDSVIYEGEFYDSEFHGHGINTSPEGHKCIGEWKAGYIWNGTIYEIDGNIITRDVARYFCIPHSYFSTLKKQRQHLLDCLEEALRGNDPTDALAL